MKTSDPVARPFLCGPDPELFRTTYRQSRWYVDPLPADGRWEATEARWPSVSTVKKAWSKPFRKKLPTGDLVPLDAYWAAEYIVDHHEAIQGLDRDGAIHVVATSGVRHLNRAADRGTDVHTVMERLALGEQVDEIALNAEARPFLPACRAYVAEVRPTWLMSEVVAINRSVGFGGTADALKSVRILGTTMVDYKTRGTDHGAYEEDAAQVGGYSLAEYFVVVDPDTGALERVEPPKIDSGLIVSLTAEGYRLYPVDIELARNAFLELHETWKHRRDGTSVARKAIGRPLILLAAGDAETGNGSGSAVTASTSPAPTASGDSAVAPAASPEATLSTVAAVDLLKQELDATEAFSPKRLGWLQGRVAVIKAHSPDARALLAEFWSRTEVPTFPAGGPRDDDELTLIAQACDEVEGRFEISFPDENDPAAKPIEKKKTSRKAKK